MEIEIKPFDEVIQDITRKFPKIPKSQYLEEGKFAIIDQSQAFISGYTDEKNKVNSDNLPVIIFGDHTKNLKYIDFPISLGADGAKALSSKSDKYDIKYLFYALRNINLPDAGYSRHFKYLKEKNIPIPKDISDQKRIAQVLSDCEDLIAKRKESIALLDEFVKSIFLEMFGDPRNENEAFVSLGELGTWKSGGTPSRKKPEYFNGSIPWVSSGELNEIYIEDTNEKISQVALQNSNAKLIPENGLLLGMYDTAALKSSIVKRPLACNQAIAYSNLEKRKCEVLFVYYAIQIGKEYFKSKQRGVRQKNMNLTMIRKLQIPFPATDEQFEFAKIVKKIEQIKTLYQFHLKELENLFGRLRQDAFKGTLNLRKVSIQVDQKGSITPTKQVINNELDYTTLFSIKDVDTYLENKLKNNFKNKEFTFEDLKELLIADFSSRYNQYDYDKWKNNFFEILGEKSSYITQFFDAEQGTIKFKISDEIN